MKANIKNLLSRILLLVVLFFLAISFWSAPFLFKGYNAETVAGISMSRNMAEAGIFAIESKLNVVLSSSLVAEQGAVSGLSNKFTSFFYSGLWSLFDGLGPEKLFLVDLVLEATVLLLFAILVMSLFGLRTAFFFGLIYIFIPFNWEMAYEPGSYEVALIFIALFFLFFFWAQKDSLKKYARFFLILSGIFLATAIFARETFILLPPFLILFLLWKKRKEQLVFIMIPVVLLMGVFWLPDFVKTSNFNLLPGVKNKQSETADFSFYAHLYPDPYTYHFNKEEFLKEKFENYDRSDLSIAKVEGSKVMKNVGARSVSFLERIKVSLVIGVRHLARFISLEDIGGPFVFLLLILGFYYLKKNYWELGQFFLGWIGFSILTMSLVLLLSRNHLMDFNWAIALIISLGVLVLSRALLDYLNFSKKKLIWVQLFILGVLLYNFLLANHVVFGDLYDKTKVPKLEAYSQEIKSFGVKNSQVIAVDVHGSSLYHLNYLTDKSFVMFRKNTIENLIEKDQLDNAFDKFNVDYVLGYSEGLTEEILKNSDVENIATSSLKPKKHSLSRNKGWLMNLVK